MLQKGSKLKIAHVSMFYYPTIGGVEQVIQELAERQVRAGHEVHVFCCDSDKHNRIKQKEEVYKGVHIHRSTYWFNLSISTFIWPGLLLSLLKYDFDIIHSHVSGHLYVLLAGIAKKKSKYIHTTHCPWTDKYRKIWLRPFVFMNNIIFNKIAFKKIDKIIAITPWEISTLKKWVSEEKITVIPNGMDNILFERIEPNNFKAKFNGKIVLFLGRLNQTKGPDKLALVAKDILKERQDIDFVFIGPDEGFQSEVEKIVDGDKHIHILGPIRGKKNIAEAYQAADIYVLPSYREGMPLTLIEAFASGLPVVASPVNGVPYEMEDNINGFFADYGDLKVLKEKILFLLDNKDVAERISKNNIEKSKAYDWDLITEKYMGEYYG